MSTNQIPARNVPQQARSRQRRQRILVVAADLYYREGYDVVTTNMIADAAGVPIGSVYRYFTAKSDILEAVAGLYAGAAMELLASMRDRWTAGALTDRQLVEFLCLSVVEFCRTNPLAGQLLVDDFHPAIARAGGSLRHIFVSGFEDFIEPRLDSSRDCTQVARTVFDAVRSIIWRYLNGNPAEQLATMHETCELLARYIGSPVSSK